MTEPAETLEHLDVDPALRPLARAMAVRGPGWWTVLRMELRKTVDTPADRWVLIAVLALTVAAVVDGLLDVRAVAATDPSAGTLPRYLDGAFDGVALLLPVLGVLAMTSEWSRRTALSTFTLVPRRGRVLSAKVAAALAVVVAASLVCALVVLAVTVQTARSADVPLVLDGAAAAVLQQVAVVALTTLMAVGLGALAGSTPVGVVAFYVLPLVSAVAAARVLGDGGVWVDGHRAFEQVAGATVTSWAQTGTALAVWVVLPLVAGVVRCLRREVR